MKLLVPASLALLSLASPAVSAPSDHPVCEGSEGYAASFGGRRTFALTPNDLEAIKAKRTSDPVVAAAYRDLIARADHALAARPASVMDKQAAPSSGDRHDYVSLARYWWPDPANPAGPYVRRDGDTNPEIETNRFDRIALARMAREAETLALAYYYSGDTRYADGAARAIRTWFLDPATAMNPNMDFAQAVPGVANGRAEGVLDGAGFIGVIDAAGLIAPAGSLSPAENAALENWFARYVDWMQNSANGRAEAAARNNHGLWYDAQLARFALFARRPDIARDIALHFTEGRIDRQVDGSGAMPAELTRTRSFHYSLYALDAAYTVADSAACIGIDLYAETGPKGHSLRQATDYLAAYRGRAADWPYKEKDWPADMLDGLLVRADRAWGPGVYPRHIPADLVLRYRVP